MLADFAGLMFKRARPDGFISLRLFADKGSKHDKPIDIEAIQLNDKDFLNVAMIRAEQAARAAASISCNRANFRVLGRRGGTRFLSIMPRSF